MQARAAAILTQASPNLHRTQAAVWLELVCVGAPAAAAHSAELGMELALQWRARARPPPACAGVGGAGEAEEGAEGGVEEGVAGGAAAGGAAAGGVLGAVPLRLVLAVACTGAELSLLVSRDGAREAEQARRHTATPPHRHLTPYRHLTPHRHLRRPPTHLIAAPRSTLHPRLLTPECASPTVTPAGTHLPL